jgi:hypothetical protein
MEDESATVREVLKAWQRHWRRVLLLLSAIMLLLLRPTYRTPKPLSSMEWLGQPASLTVPDEQLMRGVPMSNAAQLLPTEEIPTAHHGPHTSTILDAAASSPGFLSADSRVMVVVKTSTASESYIARPGRTAGILG